MAANIPDILFNADDAAIHVARERDEAAHNVSIWNSNKRSTGNRRMAAVGLIDPAWGTLGWGETYVNDDGDVFRWYPLDDGGPTIVRGSAH